MRRRRVFRTQEKPESCCAASSLGDGPNVEMLYTLYGPCALYHAHEGGMHLTEPLDQSRSPRDGGTAYDQRGKSELVGQDSILSRMGFFGTAFG